MKKGIISLVFLGAIAVVVLAQEPYFYTILKFEDALGNKDSVTVGFDPTASERLDPQFDGEELTAPFDSVFEVRAGSRDFFYREKLSKTIIEGAERIWGLPGTIYGGGRVFVYVWAKHQPVKVRWDQKEFRTYYDVQGSIICNHFYDELIYPYDWDWLPQNIYRCMAGTDSLIIDLTQEEAIRTSVRHPVMIEKLVVGLGLKKIYGLSFVPSPLNEPCKRHVNVENQWLNQKLQLQPNPATDAVTLSLTTPLAQSVTIAIFNYLGEKVLEKQLPKGQSEVTVPVSYLPNGLYCLSLLENGRELGTRKVVIFR